LQFYVVNILDGWFDKSNENDYLTLTVDNEHDPSEFVLYGTLLARWCVC